ncbi:MAG: glucose-6-phosphate isomerase [Firmicutes bacterium]|nr:glucose-6-phosphate isomerase [Bacillota bacterium]
MTIDYHEKIWCEQNKIHLDFNYVMQEFVGSEQGLSEDDFKSLDTKISHAVKQIKNKRAEKKLEWMNLPYTQESVVEEILNYAEYVQKNFGSVVIFGIGGSALGPIALQQAINHPFYNEISKEKRKYPKFYVADNIDPERLVYLLDVVDIEKTLFIIISKSGSTSETMSQFMIIKNLLDEKNKELEKKNIVCITDETKGNLIKIAKREGYKTFYIPNGVGGRFSELCPVGLLPAAICGIDIKKLLAGAEFMDKNFSDEPKNNIATKFALINYLAMQKKQKNICVMMPYADSLKYIADWFAQIWSESLGKAFDNNGNLINIGQTPVKSLGVTDQHSQVQLYNEGPFDKIIVFLKVEKYRKNIFVPKIFEDIDGISFLGGISHEDLIHAELKATEFALAKSKHMNMKIILPEINEFVIGELFFALELATALMGEFLNINAFDQPGVEEGKNMTYAIFNKPGYENKKHELENMLVKKRDYFV